MEKMGQLEGMDEERQLALHQALIKVFFQMRQCSSQEEF
jgi:hypothetical protein